MICIKHKIKWGFKNYTSSLLSWRVGTYRWYCVSTLNVHLLWLIANLVGFYKIVNYIIHGVTFIHVTCTGNLNFYRVMISPHGANWLKTVSDTEELVSIYWEIQNWITLVMTCVWTWCDMCLSLVWHGSELGVTCLSLVWHVSEIDVTCVWAWCDICLSLVWHVSGLGVTYVWNWCDMSLNLVWHVSTHSPAIIPTSAHNHCYYLNLALGL